MSAIPYWFILVRHEQTGWNHAERFCSRTEVPLNETDLTQAGATAQRVATQWVPAAIYSSPLSRAVRIVEAIDRYIEYQCRFTPTWLTKIIARDRA